MYEELGEISLFVSLRGTGIKWAFDQLVDVHEPKFSLVRPRLPVSPVYCYKELKDYVLIARGNNALFVRLAL